MKEKVEMAGKNSITRGPLKQAGSVGCLGKEGKDWSDHEGWACYLFIFLLG